MQVHAALFLDNRKEKSIQTYVSSLSRHHNPATFVYIRLMSSGFSDVDYKGGRWHDIQVRSFVFFILH